MARDKEVHDPEAISIMQADRDNASCKRQSDSPDMAISGCVYVACQQACIEENNGIHRWCLGKECPKGDVAPT